MEVLSLIFGYFGGWIFPYISRIHTAYIGEYLHFRYLKCLVKYNRMYTPGSSNKAGWKMGAPDLFVDVFSIKHGDIPAGYVSLPGY